MFARLATLVLAWLQQGALLEHFRPLLIRLALRCHLFELEQCEMAITVILRMMLGRLPEKWMENLLLTPA